MTTAIAMTLLLGLAGLVPLSEDEPASRGLVRNTEAAQPGYALVSPLKSTSTYLIDLDGKVVHTWNSEYAPGSPYLLANGHLLRSAQQPDAPVFSGGGQNGRIQEFTWDGELVWDYLYASEQHLQHHDLEPLPNGNILFIAWEYQSVEEAVAAGREPEVLGDRGFWPDKVVEVKPILPDSAEVVWEWRLWDHLIQDRYPDQANFGVVGEHPELVDINADNEPRMTAAERAQLEALGYLAEQSEEEKKKDKPRVVSDFNHTNAVNYNAELDQIVISVKSLGEIWIIDHSTTTEEAASHSGGRWGKGGDLLYRWGNPKNYDAGTKADQKLFGQHDVRWILPGYPGAGKLMVFNNGRGRPDGDYSSVDVIATPLDPREGYLLEPGEAYGPEQLEWTYRAPEGETFFSSYISGAHRCPDGNTFVCSGSPGRLFQVSPEGEIVWEYLNPFADAAIVYKKGGGAGRRGDYFGMFRASCVPANHEGLRGKNLTPLEPQPEAFKPKAEG